MPSPASPAPAGIELRAARDLGLIPYPCSVSHQGAPWHAPPSLYLHVPSEPYASLRPRAQIIAKQLTASGLRTQLDSSPALSGFQAVLSSSPTVAKEWAKYAKPLRGLCGKEEGYRVTVNDEGALLQANDEKGFYYGGQTLRQLLENRREVPGLIIEDGPLLPFRAIHLDLRGWPPTRAYLEETIDRLSHCKLNVLILEYERFFGFNSQPGLAAPEAFPPNYIAELDIYARERGVTLVPLLHCLGHVGHLLRLETYQHLREEPRYCQQLCPSHPATLEIYSAMAEDILAAHGGPLIHIGGDGAQFLGVCPACQARAKELGGRGPLYLDYVGRVSRYLISRGRRVLLWDEVARNMTDEQFRRLPPEVWPVFCHFAGHEGRATPEMLVPLDRYKKLGRRCWGAACRLPAEGYEALDNLDAWAEAAEMGYLEGLVTTTWTRDEALGALLAPPETAWPAAFYAAERAWGGRANATREQFFLRFSARFFGLEEQGEREQAWAVFDLMARNHPRETREYLRQVHDRCRRNQNTLAFLDCWCALAAFRHYVQRFEESVSSNFRNLRAGEGDPFQAGRLRWRIEDLKSKAAPLLQLLQERTQRLTPPSSAEECLNNHFAYDLSRLEELSTVLARYPMPDHDWQQPVRI